MSEMTRRGVLFAGTGAAAASAATAGFVLTGAATTAGWPWTSRLRGTRTSFGAVALLGSSQRALSRAGHAASGSAHDHPDTHGREISGTPVPSAVHGAWTDAVAVDVEVHNGSRAPMELSPGQFRLRLSGGPTVSLYSSDRDAGPVGPGETTTLRIRYLAPPPDQPLSLEFDDTGADRTVQLGRLRATGATS